MVARGAEEGMIMMMVVGQPVRRSVICNVHRKLVPSVGSLLVNLALL